MGKEPRSIAAAVCTLPPPFAVRLSAGERAEVKAAAEALKTSMGMVLRVAALRLARSINAQAADPDGRQPPSLVTYIKNASLARYRGRRIALKKCWSNGCERPRAPQRKRCADCLERRRIQRTNTQPLKPAAAP